VLENPRLVRLLAVLLLVALTVPVGTAQAGFRVNRSMDGIALGASESHVRALRGAPERRILGPDFVTWRYRHPFLEVSFKPRAITLYTRSPLIRGPQGVGVRTSEHRLRTVLPSARCATRGGERLCVVGSFATGRRSTVFAMRDHAVRDVTISVSTP
jgi:hypothetical protein